MQHSDDLEKSGFVPLGQIMDAESCRNLEKFSDRLPYYVCHSEVVAVRNRLKLYDVADDDYERDHHYKVYRLADLLLSREIRQLISSRLLHSIAGDYLGNCRLSSVILWKSYPAPDSVTAQRLHRDAAKIKTLAAFIYINDVSHLNGPHTYIRCSHRDGTFQEAIATDDLERKLKNELADSPKRLWEMTFEDDGYAHNLDGAFRKAAPDLVYTHTGGAGSCLVTEPIGLHRGDPLLRGHRTVLSLRWNPNKSKPSAQYDFNTGDFTDENGPGLLNDIQALLKQISA